ncbi:hypothetical protein [Aminobacter sp. BE322]|uniref:hypothetical protein n=1 Tax=unclassified Aminobacter TaxID=2644704 RepID=UPI003D24B02E
MNSDEIGRLIANRNRKIRRLLSHGVSVAPQAFEAATGHARAVALNLVVERSLSNKAAREALASTHSALAELSRRNPGMRPHYNRLMDVVLVELAKLTQIALDSENYQPLTDAFKGAKAKLDDAYQQARKTIAGMKNATAILAAFGALVGAL